jgi:FkbM family methyltransferase
MLAQYCGAERVRLPGPRLEASGQGLPTGNVTSPVPLPTAEAGGLTWIQRGQHTDDWIAGAHEDFLEPTLTGHLPEGGVFLDVGAHIGRWSLRMAKRAARVIAVEANPDTAAVWRANAALNGITNAELVEVAAWDEPGRVRLEDPNAKFTGGSTRAFADEAGGVEALPLDAVLEDEPRIDLVKLDVEGADLRALDGMAGTLSRLRPVLVVEDHSIYGYYPYEDLVATLKRLGYQAEPFTIPAGGNFAAYVLATPAEPG